MEGVRRPSRVAGFWDLFGREIPWDIVETDIAGVRADALIIVIAARETQLEVVNERDVVVGANDGQHEFAEDALRREVPFRRIADARSAGRISDKNAVAERLPAHFAHDSGQRPTAGQPGEAAWPCKSGRIGRDRKSTRLNSSH